MRVRIALLLVLLSIPSPGCLLHEATCVVANKTFGSLDDCKERWRNQKWAKEAWKGVVRTVEKPFSNDYADGFKTGFADYVYWGGTGELPPLAPRRYRKLRYQTPEGYHAVEEWFAGYRHGAAESRNGEYRRWVTGPSPLAVWHAPPPLPHAEPMLPPDDEVPTRIPIKVVPQNREQELPAPRKAVPDKPR